MTGFPKVLIGNATDAVRKLKMTDEELRKLVSDTKGLVADELFFKDDAELITGLSDALLTLLARAEKAEHALQRVRELHQPRMNSMSALYPEPLCSCQSLYPCLTIKALEGNDG